ncbi:MAG: transketolase C-terminal domain-containing protein, partial [Rikenellaceae bacterium]
ATHHGAYDLAYLSAIPQMVVAAPRNELELRQMMFTALGSDRPFAIRYPRGGGEGVEWRGVPFEPLEIGRGVTLREGSGELAVVTIGTVAVAASKAIDRVSGTAIAHYDMRFAKPLDYKLLEQIGAKHRRIVTIEDGALRGGVGEAIAAHFNRCGFDCHVTTLGIPDRFIDHATVAELHVECGYAEQQIFDLINGER